MDVPLGSGDKAHVEQGTSDAATIDLTLPDGEPMSKCVLYFGAYKKQS